jgi:hypothetical protein
VDKRNLVETVWEYVGQLFISFSEESDRTVFCPLYLLIVKATFGV